MSIPEEAGKVAGSAIDALKGSPGLLVLVLLQAAIMGMLYFVAEHNADRWQERQLLLIERCYSLDREKN